MSNDEWLTDVLSLDRYPVHEPGTPAYARLITFCREALAEDGCCVLRSFLHADAVHRITLEAERLAPLAHRSRVSHNPYFCAPQPELGAAHPFNRLQERSNGFVCADLIDPESDLQRLYGSMLFTSFISDAFNIHPLHKYADPLACMPLNTMQAGDAFPWHFDTNEFTVTLMIQPAGEGGLFEYAPGIRAPRAEHYDDVAAVMSGNRDRVRTLELGSGDMQLFLGRYTLHRVTTARGSRARHVAIPSWTRQPGVMGQPERVMQLYGRVLPAHLEMAGRRLDDLAD